MAKSGVSYYVENFASFDYENEWKVWFDAKTSSVAVPNRSISNSLYSGSMFLLGLPAGVLLSRAPDCITVLPGRYGGISIIPQTGLWSEDFSLIFLNKKKTVGKTLIFNCMSTGWLDNEVVYRGYRIGYTDSNKPFFEYYGKNGFESFVGDYNLPTDHSLNFVKAGNSLTIGQYDFLSQTNNSQSFNIDSSYLFEPTGGYYYLGYTASTYLPIFPSYETNSGMVSIDEFLYFTHALYDYDIQVINSGFVADYVAPVTGSGILYSTGITGYSTGLVPLLTGITGYGITGTGLFTDDFGVEFTGYQTGALYANLSGTGVVPLTGIIQTVDYYLGNGSVVLDSGYMKTFYNSGQCFLRNVDNSDIIESFNETGKVDWIETEQYGKYDIVKSKFKIFESSPSILSLNGQIKYAGPLVNTGTIYNPALTISGDYYNTGYYLESLSGFSQNDTVFTFGVPLSVTYNSGEFCYSGGAPYTGSGLLNDNSLVFFNGIKLNSSQYSKSGSNLIISTPLYNGITGRLLISEFSGALSGNSGTFLKNLGARNPYYSNLFMNGQLLHRDRDYLAISPYSLLNNSGIFSPSESANLYNDLNSSDLFWTN